MVRSSNRKQPVESSIRGATEAAYAALARRPLSEKELQRKLLLRGFTSEHVNEALIRCREYGYLNDEELVKRQAAALARDARLGGFAVSRKLETKGFSRELVEQAMTNLSANVDVPSEDVRASEAAAKRFRGQERQPEMREKVIRFLRSRGFDWEVIQSVIGSQS